MYDWFVYLSRSIVSRRIFDRREKTRAGSCKQDFENCQEFSNPRRGLKAGDSFEIIVDQRIDATRKYRTTKISSSTANFRYFYILEILLPSFHLLELDVGGKRDRMFGLKYRSKRLETSLWFARFLIPLIFDQKYTFYTPPLPSNAIHDLSMYRIRSTIDTRKTRSRREARIVPRNLHPFFCARVILHLIKAEPAGVYASYARNTCSWFHDWNKWTRL